MNDVKYLPRLIDKKISSRLKDFGAVYIEGCKWCGKSTTAKQFAKSSVELQNTSTNQNTLAIAANQPSLILQGEKPRLIDEWQDAPEGKAGAWNTLTQPSTGGVSACRTTSYTNRRGALVARYRDCRLRGRGSFCSGLDG